MNRPKQFLRKPMMVLGMLGLALGLLVSACRQSPQSDPEPTSSDSQPPLSSVDGSTPAGEPGLLTPSASERAVEEETDRPQEATTPADGNLVAPAADATAGSLPSRTATTAAGEEAVGPTATARPTRRQGATQTPGGEPNSTGPPPLPTIDITELALTAPPQALEATPTINQADRPPGSSDGVVISALEITRERVTVAGVTTVAADNCVLTRLTADEQEVPWWPTDLCATRQGSSWELAVLLEAGATLDPAVQYVLVAWLEDEPTVVSQPFPWDIAGPPGS